MSWLTRLFHKDAPAAAAAPASPPPSSSRLDDLRARRAAEQARADAAAREAAEALVKAARTGDLEAVTALLDTGAGVDTKAEYGAPVLNIAAAWGHAPIVELLLARGADPNSAEKKGNSALIEALFGGSEAAVRMLIAAGADIQARASGLGYTTLDAAESGCLPEIASTLREAGVEATKSRAEHLDSAASRGRLAAVEYHLAAGPLLDADALGKALARVGQAGLNERAQSADIALALIAAGADVDFRDEFGTPVLLHAVHHGNGPLVRCLVVQGADPHLPDKHGESALNYASRGRSDQMQAIARDLAEARPSRAGGGEGLAAAARRGDLASVQRALGAGADVNSRDGDGVPALVLAATHGHGSVVELLLARGADMTLTAQGGLTAMEAAVLANQSDALRFLVAAEETASRT